MANVVNRKFDYKQYSVHAEIFDGTNQLYEIISKRKNNSHYDRRSHDYYDHPEHHNGDWIGIKSKEEGEQYLKYGYDKNVDAIKSIIDTSVCGEKIGVVPVKDICGGNICVADYLSGNPNCFRRNVRGRRGANVVSVFYDMGTSWGTSPKALMNRGLALLNAIARCERGGKRIELYTCNSYHDHRTTIDILGCKVKGAGEMFDAKRVAFGTTCPAFFRWLGFSWFVSFPDGRDCGSGLGCQMFYNLSDEDCNGVISKMFNSNGVYIKNGDINLGENASKESILDEAVKLVEKINKESKQFLQH